MFPQTKKRKLTANHTITQYHKHKETSKHNTHKKNTHEKTEIPEHEIGNKITIFFLFFIFCKNKKKYKKKQKKAEKNKTNEKQFGEKKCNKNQTFLGTKNKRQ